jgi:hypothetical protein
MTNAASEPSSPEPTSRRADGAQQSTPGIPELARPMTLHARTSAVLSRVPGLASAIQYGIGRTMQKIQDLPDSTLRSIAAGSIGLSSGFYLAGKPRSIVAAGIAPALITGAAIAFQPRGQFAGPKATR